MKYSVYDCRKGEFSVWNEIETSDIEKYLSDLIYEEERIYDADICGDENFIFIIAGEEKDKFLKIRYGWYIEYEPEWELIDYIEYEYIDSIELKYPSKNRDWIKI